MANTNQHPTLTGSEILWATLAYQRTASTDLPVKRPH